MTTIELGWIPPAQETGLDIMAWACPRDTSGDTVCTQDICNEGRTCGGDGGAEEELPIENMAVGTNHETVDNPKPLDVDEGALCGAGLTLITRGTCPTPRYCNDFGCFGDCKK